MLSASLANGSPKHPAKAQRKVASATASHPSATASRKKARQPVDRETRSTAAREAKQPATRTATRAAGRATKGAASKRASEASEQEPARTSQAVSRKSSRKSAADAEPLPTPAKQASRSAAQTSRSRQAVKVRGARGARSGAKLVRVTETSTPTRPIADDTASLGKTRFAMPPPLRGSYESLLRQNQRTEADGLERIQDDEDLNDRINRGMLVPVPGSSSLMVDSRLPENRRYCRPWTASFLADLSHAHAAQFRDPLFVSSAVRTVAFQKQLMRTNGNATSAEGDIASPHLTGATIDIAKHGMSNQEVGWMRAWLLPLQEAGMIDVEEEFQQSCFHITVYKSSVLANPSAMPVVQASTVPVQALPVRPRAEQAPARPSRSEQRKTTPKSRLRQRKPEEAKREQPRPRRRTSAAESGATAQGL